VRDVRVVRACHACDELRYVRSGLQLIVRVRREVLFERARPTACDERAREARTLQHRHRRTRGRRGPVVDSRLAIGDAAHVLDAPMVDVQAAKAQRGRGGDGLGELERHGRGSRAAAAVLPTLLRTARAHVHVLTRAASPKYKLPLHAHNFDECAELHVLRRRGRGECFHVSWTVDECRDVR
jgi:hypothetical protein